MIDLNNLVPDVYKTSRDFRVFLRLLELVISDIKYDIDNWLDLYSPLKCPMAFLPYLADLIGYNYNTQLSVKENRIIMSKFVNMIKNKGSDIGIRTAAALSLNAQLASDPSSKEYQEAVMLLQQLETYFDKDTGMITIYYPKDLKKVRDLLYYVRPVGTFIEYIPSVMSDVSSNALGIHTMVDTVAHTYDIEKSSKINHAQIGVSKISSHVPKFEYVTIFKVYAKDDNGNEVLLDPDAEQFVKTLEAIDRAHAISQIKKQFKPDRVEIVSCKRKKTQVQ